MTNRMRAANGFCKWCRSKKIKSFSRRSESRLQNVVALGKARVGQSRHRKLLQSGLVKRVARPPCNRRLSAVPLPLITLEARVSDRFAKSVTRIQRISTSSVEVEIQSGTDESARVDRSRLDERIIRPNQIRTRTHDMSPDCRRRNQRGQPNESNRRSTCLIDRLRRLVWVRSVDARVLRSRLTPSFACLNSNDEKTLSRLFSSYASWKLSPSRLWTRWNRKCFVCSFEAQ